MSVQSPGEGHIISCCDCVQGTKKVSFTACHSGKLELASTSPQVISTIPKTLFDWQD